MHFIILFGEAYTVIAGAEVLIIILEASGQTFINRSIEESISEFIGETAARWFQAKDHPNGIFVLNSLDLEII